MDGQRHLTEKQKKWIAGSGLALFFLLSLLICWFAGRPLIHFAQEPERFRQWVDAQGVLAPLLFTGMIILQVIVAVIPGEPLEIAAGYAFGAIEGTFLCVLGTFLGSMLVFILVRRFGRGFVELFVDGEKIDSFSLLRADEKKESFLFLIFLFPLNFRDFLCAKHQKKSA